MKRTLGKMWDGRGEPPLGSYTRKQAEHELRDFIAQLGHAPVGPNDDVTFDQAAREWLRYVEHDRRRRPSTLRDYRASVKVHLSPAFGSRPIRTITVEDIDAWRAQKVTEGRLSPRTVNKLLTLLHGIFVRAQRSYGLQGNPAAAAERQPQRHHGDIDVLDPDEVLLLAANAEDPQDAVIYTVAAFAGLRLGELLAPQWRDVNFAKRLIHVRWSYVQRHQDRPKSHRVPTSRSSTRRPARSMSSPAGSDGPTGTTSCSSTPSEVT